MKTLDIAKASVLELKATSFDLVIQIQKFQTALNEIWAELQKREQNQSEPVPRPEISR